MTRLENNAERPCTVVFARAPEQGKVKTRLAQVLPAGTVLQIYRYFVEDLLEMLWNAGTRIVVCYTPREASRSMAAWLGTEYELMPQQGAHLGERMANAFRELFARGWTRIVLVGSDFPDLPGSVIQEAFERIEDHQAVIGPARDGGYYLIGFNAGSFLPDVFEEMPWGTDGVYTETMGLFARRGVRVHLLRPWQDIDDIADLLDFAKRNINTPDAAPRSLAYLRKIGFF